MGRLRERGSTLIYVSHRLEEVFRVCDSVTVLRDGCVAATCRTAETDEAAVVRAMIGRSLDAYFPTHLERPPGEELLRVEGLTVPGLVEDVSLRVHAGEVVGMAGLVGAGRTETAEALFGLRRPSAGRVLLRGKPVAFGSPRAAMAQGIGLVPEDRKRHGLILGMTVRENTTLPFVSRLSRGGWVDRRRETALVGEYCRRLNVRTPSLSAPVAGLSGGNQQKLIIARWLAAECGVLLVDEPTRGVDVGAKAEIHGLVDRLAASGAGVLLISSELPELLNLSSRILVLRAGRVMAELPRAEATQEALMRHMAGLR
jgi:ABC-type sugar transport system ATPase subunit